ncbi:MAG TPA: hypothetical protein VFW14_10920 [Gaiellales bacterium]|nr:hypothetical protein [Gaiellales bacterium]
MSQVVFEGTPYFRQFGLNIQVIWPGRPNGYYHAERDQEDFLGAGDGPCAFIGIGARQTPDAILYTVSELALRHRAGVTAETAKPAEAYAILPETTTRPYRGGLPGDG